MRVANKNIRYSITSIIKMMVILMRITVEMSARMTVMMELMIVSLKMAY